MQSKQDQAQEGRQSEQQIEELLSPSQQNEVKAEARESLKPPEGMSAEEVQYAEEISSDIVNRLTNAQGEIERIDIEDQISNLGMKVETLAVNELKGLLGQRVGQMLQRDKRLGKGQNQQMTKDLVNLRKALREITPSEVEKSLLGRIPIIGNRLVRVMEAITEKYDSVAKVIGDIEKSLRAGRARLLQDNAELKVALDYLLGQQKVVEHHIYLGKLVLKKLDELIAETTDTQRQAELREVLHNVISRVDALVRVKELFTQIFVEIRLTRDTNFKLVRTVDTAVSAGMAVTTAGVLLYSALQRQAEIIAVLTQHREFLEKQMVTVAEMIRDHQGKAYEFLREPLASMAKIEQAHNILLEALKDRDRFIQEGIDSARVNIPKLERMADELSDKVKGVRVEELTSLELGELPSRPVGSTARATI